MLLSLAKYSLQSSVKAAENQERASLPPRPFQNHKTENQKNRNRDRFFSRSGEFSKIQFLLRGDGGNYPRLKFLPSDSGEGISLLARFARKDSLSSLRSLGTLEKLIPPKGGKVFLTGGVSLIKSELFTNKILMPTNRTLRVRGGSELPRTL